MKIPGHAFAAVKEGDKHPQARVKWEVHRGRACQSHPWEWNQDNGHGSSHHGRKVDDKDKRFWELHQSYNHFSAECDGDGIRRRNEQDRLNKKMRRSSAAK